MINVQTVERIQNNRDHVEIFAFQKPNGRKWKYEIICNLPENCAPQLESNYRYKSNDVAETTGKIVLDLILASDNGSDPEYHNLSRALKEGKYKINDISGLS